MKTQPAVRFLAPLFLFVAGCLLTASPGMARSSAPTSATIELFFTGKRRSNLEPCGCFVKQSGGLQYEATLYDQLASTSSALRLDTGEWTNAGIEQAPVDAMKTRYMLRALARLGFDAVNAGATDARLSADYWKNFRKKYPEEIPNLISANIFRKERPTETAFPASRIVERTLPGGAVVRIGITGASAAEPVEPRLEPYVVPYHPGPDGLYAIDPQLRREAKREETPPASFLIKPARVCLAPVVAGLRPRVDLLVVLYAGSLARARELARALPQADCVIAAGRLDEAATADDRAGRPAVLLARGMFGREIGRAALARTGDGPWRLPAEPVWLAVGREYAEKKPLLALLAEFKKETQSLAVPLPKGDEPQIYAGARACARCHGAIYQSWAKTRHARALQTLADKGQQFNPECVKCHVTGYRQANGFYAVTHAPSQKLAGVQCEVCHGPAREHANLQLKIADNVKNWMEPEEYRKLEQRAAQVRPLGKVAKTLCIGCHTSENYTNFKYDQKEKIFSH